MVMSLPLSSSPQLMPLDRVCTLTGPNHEFQCQGFNEQMNYLFAYNIIMLSAGYHRIMCLIL